MTDYTDRARAAYYRSPNPFGWQRDQPGSAEQLEVDGKIYVRLTNVRGILAVYRVRMVKGVAMLKGLKRWPAAVEEGV